jgi:hypothetical protein
MQRLKFGHGLAWKNLRHRFEVHLAQILDFLPPGAIGGDASAGVYLAVELR